jgi:hypothetical protein
MLEAERTLRQGNEIATTGRENGRHGVERLAHRAPAAGGEARQVDEGRVAVGGDPLPRD